MKKGLLKNLFCFALAGTLLFGDAGMVLASVSNDAQPEATEIVVTEGEKQTADATTASATVTASISGEYIYYDISGYGDRFDVYINGKLYECYQNQTYYDQVWNETTQTYDSVPVEAAEFYRSDSWYGVKAGATYTIKVVPYTYSNVEGTAATSAALKVPFPSITNIELYSYIQNTYDKDGLSTGYGKYVVEGSFSVSTNGRYATYEIYRATSKSGTYSKVATTSGSGDYHWFTDTTAKMGTTYYYKIRPVALKDEYVAAKVNGSYSKVYTYAGQKPGVEAYVYYDKAGVTISAEYSYRATGFDLYRATSKGGKYSKIATVVDGEYVDKAAKKGTYYYKVKPFYYDSVKKKKTYGELSDPMGVKLSLGITSGIEATQTAETTVKLTWEAVKGAKVYEIYKKDNSITGSGYTYVGSTKKLSYTLKKLSKDTYYTFVVRACKKANSVKSEYVRMSTSISTGFDSPRNLRITKKDVSAKNSTIYIKSTLKWDRVYGAKKYVVEARNRTTGNYDVVKTITNTKTTSYTITNSKKKDGSWKYGDVRVTAVKGDQQTWTYLYEDIDALACVGKVSVKRNAAQSAKVSWSGVDGANMYEVYRYSAFGNSVYIGSTKNKSIIDKKLTPGVTYTYRVYAYNTAYGVSSGYSYYDDEPTYIADYKHAMAKPTISTVKNSAAKTAKLTWKASAYATKYVIYRATSKNGEYKWVATTSNLSYTDKKLTKGKTYYYKIMAQTTNDAGLTVSSSKSAVKGVKIKK